ncbi:unnamed protein product [Owenia fusiformis]|uniref:C2H2-type domain-containing protein n=1 Tax=Owenia fusiformis TaxID=6347 RepID=A0A8S4P6C4_OWEFU|nr:unnamed protein product [Owenia fusiformis]
MEQLPLKKQCTDVISQNGDQTDNILKINENIDIISQSDDKNNSFPQNVKNDQNEKDIDCISENDQNEKDIDCISENDQNEKDEGCVSKMDKDKDYTLRNGDKWSFPLNDEDGDCGDGENDKYDNDISKSNNPGISESKQIVVSLCPLEIQNWRRYHRISSTGNDTTIATFSCPVFKCKNMHNPKEKCLNCKTHFTKRSSMSFNSRFPTCTKRYKNTQSNTRYNMLTYREEKMFQCKLCSSKFKTFKSLKKHKKWVKHGELKCEICFKVFVKKFDYTVHMRVHTGDKWDEREKPFNCNICSKGFTSKSYLLWHLKSHTGQQTDVKCDICMREFNSNSNLVNHMRIHTGERPFKCKICSAGFTQTSNLKRHINTHSRERTFKCEICLKKFITRDSLKTHLLIHREERPFKCDMCSQAFKFSSKLQRHKKVHTGEKPFKCEICSKSYTEKAHLINHSRIHTGEKGKCFKCETCSKTFTEKGNLQRHIRIHTGENQFICKFCSMRLADKVNLTAHENLHKGIRPYKCKLCPMSYPNHSALVRHIRTHNPVALKCDICQKNFKTKFRIIGHMKRMHGGK